MNRKIGITGGIASGKSRVSKMLSGLLGCVHIDADEICRQLLEPHEEGWQEFTRVFGSVYLVEGESINRPLLRNDLFASEKFRDKVNGIIHPIAKRVILFRINQIVESDPSAKVLVEVPLLYEVHWEDLFDTVVVVYAEDETCLNRLMDRDGLDRATAAKELKSQWPLSEKVMKADHVIDNNGLLSDTVCHVEHLAELLSRNSGLIP
ncbi:MAG: dephospho-CoA kinase [Desulfobacterales bacterium]|nr:dephospho-CoA kinase [Desulfobacterales bacterium]